MARSWGQWMHLCCGPRRRELRRWNRAFRLQKSARWLSIVKKASSSQLQGTVWAMEAAEWRGERSLLQRAGPAEGAAQVAAPRLQVQPQDGSTKQPSRYIRILCAACLILKDQDAHIVFKDGLLPSKRTSLHFQSIHYNITNVLQQRNSALLFESFVKSFESGQAYLHVFNKSI